MWEQNENDPFYFNDAGNNPEAFGETVSFRHSGIGNWWTQTTPRRALAGGAVVGSFGGTAFYQKWPKVYDLMNPNVSKVGRPNELLNGPGYR
jgi:hypothetical protein